MKYEVPVKKKSIHTVAKLFFRQLPKLSTAADGGNIGRGKKSSFSEIKSRALISLLCNK